jgi:iron(III) transport system substrate-binding protein
MRVFLRTIVFFFLLRLCDVACAASVGSSLPAAKQEAAGGGYTSIANHDEIVAKAKIEGKLRVLAGMEPATIKATTAGFTKKYPFIDLNVQEFLGTDAAQRNFLEIKSGAKDWDIHRLFSEYYTEYGPYLFKLDILGMAERKVLQIPPPMIDPNQRNTLAFFSRFHVTAYNKNLLGSNPAPRSWEDLLKPEWKGRKFTLDISPTGVASLVPAWGLEKTLEFARKLASQQPVWVRGGVRALSLVLAGEVPMTVGVNFSQLTRVQTKDSLGALQYVILQPVPVRLSGLEGIQATSQNPNAALLWLEWMASLEAQKMADDYEPLGSSVFVRGGAIEQHLRGKQVSVVSWDHQQRIAEWEAKVVEAYGFPKAESK